MLFANESRKEQKLYIPSKHVDHMVRTSARTTLVYHKTEQNIATNNQKGETVKMWMAENF